MPSRLNSPGPNLNYDSDTDRKPDPASLMSPPPQSNAVTWEKKPLLGPERDLPQSVVEFLEKWHQLNPKASGRPRFAYQQSSQYPSKAFDRQGNEVSLSLYRITRPKAYQVLILYPVSGAPRIVSSMFPFGTHIGSFLTSWSDPHGGPSPEPCTVRVFGKNLQDKVQYSPQVWQKMESEYMPRLKRLQEGNGKAAVTKSPAQQQLDIPMQSRAAKRKSDGAAVQTPKAPVAGTAVRTPATAPAASTRGATADVPRAGDNAESDSESEYTSSDQSEESDEEDDDEEEDREKDESKTESATKRRKTKFQAQSSSQPAKATPSEVFFQMLYYRIDGQSESCCFPLEACHSVNDLFQRAKAFIPSSLDEINWKVLRCEIPDGPPLDIFDGCDWEFERLIERAKSIRGDKGPVYINVKPKVL